MYILQVTPNHVHELREFRASAINKEAEILRRKQDLLREMKVNIIIILIELRGCSFFC